ncbi:TetR/AcrR family transcriptional regulator [Streptomyces sp. NBC_01615]|uniref:TetR/AcrR family transcriptional regulator n=2 Tax=unclassified Streptomyces TaxID=2593676 RepID=UPI003866476A
MIVETAVTHFAQWGCLNSSMPKIAADVGISQAGLLHHFGSKQKLLNQSSGPGRTMRSRCSTARSMPRRPIR